MNILGFIFGTTAFVSALGLGKPAEFILRFLARCAMGAVVIVLINTLLSPFKIAGAGVNVVTAAVVGIFGLPGAAALTLLSNFL